MSFIEETLAASSSVGGLPSTPRSPFVKVPLWSNASMYKSFEYPFINSPFKLFDLYFF